MNIKKAQKFIDQYNYLKDKYINKLYSDIKRNTILIQDNLNKLIKNSKQINNLKDIIDKNKFTYNYFESNIAVKINDKIKKLINKNDKNSVYPDADLSLLPPPPIWSRVFIWTLSSGSILLVFWSIFTKVEETIIITGEITTITPEVQVSAIDSGRITDIYITPNQFVMKEDNLIKYEDDTTNYQLMSLGNRLDYAQYKRFNLTKSYDLKLKRIKREIEVKTEILNQIEPLIQTGGIAKIDVLERTNELLDLENDFNTVNLEKESALFNNAEEMEQVKTLAFELEAKTKRFLIKSPVSGYIQNIKYQSPGERIMQNDVVVTIIPDKDLMVSASIPSKVSAPVKIGMPATLDIDAFPSSDFGAINSEVFSLSPTTTSIKNSNNNSGERIYIAKLSILDSELPEKLNISDLKPGMAVTAKIKLREKAIISTAFNIVSDIFDPLSEQK